MTYARVALWSAAGLAAAIAAYACGEFLLTSPEMALIHPEQVQITEAPGPHYVSRASILEIFAADRGKSLLRVPLAARRRQIESIPWVEQATVRRALPNTIEVEITERTPIAFLRQGSDMDLIDVHGVILDRPVEGDFDFPVVSGVPADMSPDDRQQRLQLFSRFLRQVEAARPGASRQISEVDLSDLTDLRATISGLQGGAAGQSDSPLLVHFGDGDFQTKYANLVDNFATWRATAGRLESLDLRFNGEAVGNPDTAAPSRPPAAQQSARGAAASPVSKKHPR
jgi:cell division protein FtsQ